MEMFKLDQSPFEAKIDAFANGRRFAAYYTAIELNRGFLRTLVAHYKKVDEVKDIPAAINVLNNEFGARVAKYANILEMYMLRFSNGISNDYRIYLGELESIILDITDRANELVKRFVGHFGSHALAALDLFSSEDYEEFLSRCASSSTVSLDDFWVDNENQLGRIRDGLLGKKGNLTVREFELVNFVTAIGDPAFKYKHVSDFVISLDCPKNYEMVAHDHIFEVLIPAQDKLGGYVDF